ncbi:unnamed protein product [Tilletia controversa]|uniref:MHYT domain-containing protein n=3 Tax=Tilletia TaxID=13289 RepID=A0A8X7SWK1_9BASI|nr:hypothetical protein CF336_g2913 [Tilletia laevis]KAE8197975.1 hypothetical protein CF328_g3679 [Tilletia controversa]KAE8261719.1 hypothetical protein A4X03_0g3021 [Tilletia caries]KAE8203024.1 hypothetical protein CF335_g3189 [Tilletia laevis]KAE8247548.1 hypothetical protein A4X06_0g4374 [Tilletia controversa]
MNVVRALYKEPVLPDGISAANMTALAEYYVVHSVPQRFNPGIILASVAVATLGANSTLLLLSKRTSNKGARNVVLLVLAAATMSSVGIWGMHFIGMYMRLRPVAGVTWFIRFNPGFTVLSLFVPLIALILAFIALDDQVTFSPIRVGVSGIITGLIVSLMHYSASFKANFSVRYQPAQTVMSIVLACLAATLALVLFFRFRSQWKDSWWKRLLCSLILASGVAGMHYVACWGTSYRVHQSFVANPSALGDGNYRNNVVTIAIAVMCIVIIVASVIVAVSDVVVVRDARKKAKKVVVCSATFDKQGRLLVKSDGTMPMMVIETDVHTREILDALDNRQPIFQWLFALSWDWEIIMPFIRAIDDRFLHKAKREAEEKGRKRRMSMRANAKRVLSNRRSLDGHNEHDRTPRELSNFRDRFVHAAHALAQELEIPFTSVGVLYDHVLPTGTRSKEQTQAQRKEDEILRADDESSIMGPVPSIFGDGDEAEEGAMLFLVRELPSNAAQAQMTSERYRQKGYRLTETRFLAGVLADRVSVSKPEMESVLDSLKLYAKRGTRPVVQPSGVYAGLFGVRPSTSKEGGLDVLVYNFARHQIPAYRLPDVVKVTPEMRNFLGMLDQMSMEEAMRTCERESIRSGERKRFLQSQSAIELDEDTTVEQEMIESMIQFQTALFIALDALHTSVRFYPKIHQTARLSAEVLDVPSSMDDSTSPAEMILIQAVLPEARAPVSSYSNPETYNAPVDNMPTEIPSKATPFVFTPYTLFSKSQMMLLRGRQADDFEHEVVLEMRRRYPSCLMSESGNHFASPSSPKLLASSHNHSVTSMDKDYSEKDHIDASDRSASTHLNDKLSITAPAPTPAFRKWTQKLGVVGNEQRRRSSKDADEASLGNGRRGSAIGGLSEQLRRGSLGSSNSHGKTEEQHEMQQVTSSIPLPVLKIDDPSPCSPETPGSGLSGSTIDGSGSSPLGISAANTSSLGIRRFTEGSAPAASSPAGRFATPADDIIVEEGDDNAIRILDHDADDQVLLGSAFEHSSSINIPPMPPMPSNATPASGIRKGQGRSQEFGMARPSTAPTGGRREAALTRPRTSHANQTPAAAHKSPVLSQRHAALSSRQNEASLMARLRSDDWSTRQLQSLERGPLGTKLLGVDF